MPIETLAGLVPRGFPTKRSSAHPSRGSDAQATECRGLGATGRLGRPPQPRQSNSPGKGPEDLLTFFFLSAHPPNLRTWN